jgi:tetratricopeptide (TPR) repeat protein
MGKCRAWVAKQSRLIRSGNRRINCNGMPSKKTSSSAGFLMPAGLWLALGCFLLGAAAAGAQTLEETEQQFRRGNYDAVIQTAQTKTAAGAAGGWWTLLVKSLLTTGRYPEAYTNSLAAFNGAPGDLRVLLLAREAALFQQDTNGANRRLMEMRMIIERRARSDPSPESLVTLGEALLLLGVEPRLVLENCFRRAEKSETPPRTAFLATGNLALAKHDFALAADAFRAGLKRFPDDPDMLAGLAGAFEPGDREEMLKAIQATLDANPRHVQSLLLLADHLIDGEQYDEAEKQLAGVLKVNPFQPEALAYQAVLAHLRNEPAQEQRFRIEALKFWQTNPRVDHLIGLKLSQQYRFEEGAEAQQRSLAFDPEYLPARRQLAEDRLRLGQNESGWILAEAVHRADEYDVTAYNLVTLRDQMAKFRTLTNAEFIVRMSSLEAELYGGRVLDLLGRAKEALCRKYGVQLTRPTVVEIFPEQKDFAVRTFGMPGNPGYLGVCFGSVITANSPASQAPNPANWEDVLWHEFCHVVTLNATKNRMPRWLSEGISVYEERQANPAWGENMNLAYREMILDGELTPLGRLSSAFLAPKTPGHLQFAYYESSLAVEFIVQNFGLEAIKKILADLRAGDEINQAIAAHTVPLPDLEKQFAGFVRQKAEMLAPGADLEKPPEQGALVQMPVWEKLHPKNYYLQMRQAGELMTAKKWAEAGTVLESVASAYAGESRSENPLWLLAVTERQLNHTNAELANLQTLAKKESDFVDLYARLVELSEARGDWAAVTNHATTLLAINPLVSLPYSALAKAAVALGENDQAIVACQKLLLLDPPDPAEVHFQLARLLHARGDSEGEAKRQVLRALEDAPRFHEGQRLLLEIEAGPSRREAPAPKGNS